MPAHFSELQHLAQSLHQEHGSVAVAAASVISLTRKLFRHHAQERGLNLEPLLDLQTKCTHEWAERRGASAEQVRTALTSLMKAGQTAEMLDALPGTSGVAPTSSPTDPPPAPRGDRNELSFDAICMREKAATDIENALLVLHGITCVRYVHNGILVPRGGVHANGTVCAPTATCVTA